jgi:hypothetical protein
LTESLASDRLLAVLERRVSLLNHATTPIPLRWVLTLDFTPESATEALSARVASA